MDKRTDKPYVVFNKALNKPPTLWILPLGMVYAIGVGLLFSVFFLIIIFSAPLWVVFLFWGWIAVSYYATVGEKPWKFLNRLRPAPQWTRRNKPLTPLLDEDDEPADFTKR